MLKAAIAAGLFSLLAAAQNPAPVPQFEVAEVRVSHNGAQTDPRNAATFAGLRAGRCIRIRM